MGAAEGRPRGGCRSPFRGASEFRHSLSPGCPPSGRAVGVRYPCAVGAAVRVWGPSTVPLACMPFGGCVPRGWWGAVPGGGVAFHCCEGRLVSGAVPPPAARPLARQPGFCGPCVPVAVGVGVGTQHRPLSVRPCEPSLRAVGLAEGRPRGGCLSPLRAASEFRRSPSPGCPHSGRAVGVRYLRAVGAGVRVWGPSTVPLACMPCGGCMPRRWWGPCPGGGGLPPL